MKTVWIATAEDIIDTLVGAGAETYEWYRELDETHDGKGQIICTMETGLTDANDIHVVTVKFSPSRAKEVVNAIIKEQKAGWRTVQSAVDSDDFDADAVDVVLQHIVLGDLVFG
jgi:hypothetical protein